MKPVEEQTLVERLRNRASIRRNIKDRKSAQEGKPDRVADLLDESAEELTRLQSANADMLKALQEAFKALDAIFDEMTVGERYTNAGQYLIDAFPVVREALEKHGGKG